MIRKIKIKGFENHIDSELEFTNGVNVITGASNTGKSSIVKSLDNLINNRPSGDSFINNDINKCSIVGEFEKDTIKKYKDKTDHYYKINDNDELSALRTSVPDEVKNITKFSDTNLQSQFDKFFLLQDSAGEVARKLNEIIDLSIMDKSIKIAKSKVNKKNRDIEYNEKELKNLKDQLNTYSWLDIVENSLIRLEEDNEKLQTQDLIIDTVKDIHNNIIDIQNELNIINTNLKNKKIFNNIKKKCKELYLDIERINNIKDVYNQLKSTQNQISQYKAINRIKKDYKVIKQLFDKLGLENAKYEQIKTLYDEFLHCQLLFNENDKVLLHKNYIDGLKKDCEKIISTKEKLNILKKYIDLKNTIHNTDKELTILKKEYKELTPDICPWCKRKL